jgi:phosphohistidine phosphatase
VRWQPAQQTFLSPHSPGRSFALPLPFNISCFYFDSCYTFYSDFLHLRHVRTCSPYFEGDAMKTLLLMRHAKSSWKDTDLPDHERPLNKRGKKDSVFMGAVLNEKELLPQKILASSAVRIRETIAGMAKESAFSGEVEFSDELYLAEPSFLKTCGYHSVEQVISSGTIPAWSFSKCSAGASKACRPARCLSHPADPAVEQAQQQDRGDLIEMLPRELHELEKNK